MISTRIEDGIGHLVIDMPERSVNVIDVQLADSMKIGLRRFAEDAAVTGIVISSGKSSFVAGADLAQMAEFTGPAVTPADAMAMIGRYNDLMRWIETCGKPVVAAASGTALGGGLELMLCCHWRIAADNPKAQFGTPEVTLGLMPGSGGTQRLPRLVGIAKSLPILVQGKSLSARQALELGILDEVVSSADLLPAAVRALRDGRVRTVAPWDAKGFKLPGGDAYSPVNSNALVMANATANASTKGNYPAPQAILRAVYEGTRLPIDKGLKLEQKLFVKLVQGAVSQSMIRTLFFARQAADKLTRRPAGIAQRPVCRLGVVGAGFMGAGIAQAAVIAGIKVVFLDKDRESAERGRATIRAALQAEVAKGRRTAQSLDEVMARVEVAPSASGLTGCDMVIEAVFEDLALKARILKDVEAHLPPEATFATNTSALPVTELAKSSLRPHRIIGLHFFSPVQRMALVEVVVGTDTSEETLAHALDFVQQIRKTPIVVGDGYGFFTTRCVEAYIREGVRMLAEGVTPALVENAGMSLGFPVGPLTLADEVGIDVLHHIVHFFREREAGAWAEDKHKLADVIIDSLHSQGRLGRKAGKGFHDYADPAVKRFDFDHAASPEQPELASVKERLLYAQLVEAARCAADGVVQDCAEADLGAILGWAFPSWTGGPFAYIESKGRKAFADRCAQLSSTMGQRFALPASFA